MEELQRNPNQIYEISMRVMAEDPALFQVFMQMMQEQE
jgi:hypothetical protein